MDQLKELANSPFPGQEIEAETHRVCREVDVRMPDATCRIETLLSINRALHSLGVELLLWGRSGGGGGGSIAPSG